MATPWAANAPFRRLIPADGIPTQAAEAGLWLRHVCVCVCVRPPGQRAPLDTGL